MCGTYILKTKTLFYCIHKHLFVAVGATEMYEHNSVAGGRKVVPEKNLGFLKRHVVVVSRELVAAFHHIIDNDIFIIIGFYHKEIYILEF
jgi:hypothetical protein